MREKNDWAVFMCILETREVWFLVLKGNYLRSKGVLLKAGIVHFKFLRNPTDHLHGPRKLGLESGQIFLHHTGFNEQLKVDPGRACAGVVEPDRALAWNTETS